MPELPEVETIRGQLAPVVTGRVIGAVRIADPRWTRPRDPEEVARVLTGRRIEALGRRGKYLLWHLDGDVHVAQHLRMTGTVLLGADPVPRHAHVRLTLSGDPPVTLAVVDPRRFGTGELLASARELDAFLDARLGPEPLEARFTAEHLFRSTRGRRGPIKAFLLDQRRMAGVGNIYADEALFRARIHPLRAAGTLTRAQAADLREALIGALSDGIAARGATIDDFRHVDGVIGSFQDQFRVHRRAGLPCPECGTPVTKLVAAGRGTYVCASCQPTPRPRRRRRAAEAQPPPR